MQNSEIRKQCIDRKTIQFGWFFFAPYSITLFTFFVIDNYLSFFDNYYLFFDKYYFTLFQIIWNHA
ncbi:MAG: hypothetical protein CVU09_15800 [Bacteroidetes bacterium HGW-Bacteroidetes-4]|nr:MAG: hypothetical protein CVU09_15800 [Bacteroidetes bacterium HGW-Bacteroidetes-4]